MSLVSAEDMMKVMGTSIRKAFESDVRNALRDYKYAVERRVCAEIDAGCCRTQLDYDKAHAAIEEEAESEDKTVTELFRIMTLAAVNYKLGIL